MPKTPKELIYVCIIVPCVSISGEKAGEAFERSRWTGVGPRELEKEKTREERRWEHLGQVAK